MFDSPDPDVSSSPPSSMSSRTLSPSAAQFNETDVAFVHALVLHHRQSTAAYDVVLAKEGVDQRVRDLVARMQDVETAQIDQTRASLRRWGVDVPAPPDETRSEAVDPGAGVPGGLSEEDLHTLADVDGATASRVFLHLMVAHQADAIEIADAEISGGSDPDAIVLARTVIEMYQSEITEMRELLSVL